MAEDGVPRTDTGAPPEWLGPRHRKILALSGLAAALVGALAGLSVFCLALGWRVLAACFALATVAASPSLLFGPLQDWWRHRRGRRQRHRVRPEQFGRQG